MKQGLESKIIYYVVYNTKKLYYLYHNNNYDTITHANPKTKKSTKNHHLYS